MSDSQITVALANLRAGIEATERAVQALAVLAEQDPAFGTYVLFRLKGAIRDLDAALPELRRASVRLGEADRFENHLHLVGGDGDDAA